MTIDHEDLIAEALDLLENGSGSGWESDAEDMIRRLADALEQTTARLREAEEAIENTSHIHGPRKVWENDRAYTLVCTVCITEQYPCATVRTLSRYRPTTENGSEEP